MSKIWEKWAEHYKNHEIDPRRICKDGVIATEEFYKEETNPKVLFILRDQNNPDGGSDLREIFKSGPKYPMGYTLAIWATGILNEFPPYEQIQNNNTILKESLRKTAIINLKKAGGASQAILPVVNAYAHQDEDLLQEQLDSIKPSMIIACGTMDPLIWLLDLQVTVDAPLEKPIRDGTRNVWVIPFIHPSRKNHKNTYEQLSEMMKKIR